MLGLAGGPEGGRIMSPRVRFAVRQKNRITTLYIDIPAAMKCGRAERAGDTVLKRFAGRSGSLRARAPFDMG